MSRDDLLGGPRAEDARERNEVHNELAERVGPRTAAYVMERLPPVEWDQLVTKEYLREQLGHLEARFDARFTSLAHELDAKFERRLHDAMASQVRTIVLGQVGAVTATALAMAAILQLT